MDDSQSSSSAGAVTPSATTTSNPTLAAAQSSPRTTRVMEELVEQMENITLTDLADANMDPKLPTKHLSETEHAINPTNVINTKSTITSIANTNPAPTPTMATPSTDTDTEDTIIVDASRVPQSRNASHTLTQAVARHLTMSQKARNQARLPNGKFAARASDNVSASLDSAQPETPSMPQPRVQKENKDGGALPSTTGTRGQGRRLKSTKMQTTSTSNTSTLPRTPQVEKERSAGKTGTLAKEPRTLDQATRPARSHSSSSSKDLRPSPTENSIDLPQSKSSSRRAGALGASRLGTAGGASLSAFERKQALKQRHPRSSGARRDGPGALSRGLASSNPAIGFTEPDTNSQPNIQDNSLVAPLETKKRRTRLVITTGSSKKSNIKSTSQPSPASTSSAAMATAPASASTASMDSPPASGFHPTPAAQAQEEMPFYRVQFLAVLPLAGPDLSTQVSEFLTHFEIAHYAKEVHEAGTAVPTPAQIEAALTSINGLVNNWKSLDKIPAIMEKFHPYDGEGPRADGIYTFGHMPDVERAILATIARDGAEVGCAIFIQAMKQNKVLWAMHIAEWCETVINTTLSINPSEEQLGEYGEFGVLSWIFFQQIEGAFMLAVRKEIDMLAHHYSDMIVQLKARREHQSVLDRLAQVYADRYADEDVEEEENEQPDLENTVPAVLNPPSQLTRPQAAQPPRAHPVPNPLGKSSWDVAFDRGNQAVEARAQGRRNQATRNQATRNKGRLAVVAVTKAAQKAYSNYGSPTIPVPSTAADQNAPSVPTRGSFTPASRDGRFHATKQSGQNLFSAPSGSGGPSQGGRASSQNAPSQYGGPNNTQQGPSSAKAGSSAFSGYSPSLQPKLPQGPITRTDSQPFEDAPTLPVPPSPYSQLGHGSPEISLQESLFPTSGLASAPYLFGAQQSDSIDDSPVEFSGYLSEQRSASTSSPSSSAFNPTMAPQESSSSAKGQGPTPFVFGGQQVASMNNGPVQFFGLHSEQLSATNTPFNFSSAPTASHPTTSPQENLFPTAGLAPAPFVFGQQQPPSNNSAVQFSGHQPGQRSTTNTPSGSFSSMTSKTRRKHRDENNDYYDGYGPSSSGYDPTMDPQANSLSSSQSQSVPPAPSIFISQGQEIPRLSRRLLNPSPWRYTQSPFGDRPTTNSASSGSASMFSPQPEQRSPANPFAFDENSPSSQLRAEQDQHQKQQFFLLAKHEEQRRHNPGFMGSQQQTHIPESRSGSVTLADAPLESYVTQVAFGRNENVSGVFGAQPQQPQNIQPSQAQGSKAGRGSKNSKDLALQNRNNSLERTGKPAAQTMPGGGAFGVLMLSPTDGKGAGGHGSGGDRDGDEL